MANVFLQCNVVTPEKQVIDTQAFDVVLPAHDGLLGVLPGHAPMLCNLGTGILRYRDSENNKQILFINGGFGHIHNNEVTLLTREAIKPDQVSLSEAQEALQQAQALPKSSLEQASSRHQAIARAKELIVFVQNN